ncbi:group I truncated hemoglobin [Dokdonella fugitiva]|uniref:Hemoglobin n=1 Tax=Dokdonella fugitiva TaxID=328517 RepID=A0A4R2IAP9_9GAMM|nr:group 1 truncated hemoglobin [Dokdonella fugitiva]TCO41257.1 hemoglobin [Dokdonella fugitiva]
MHARHVVLACALLAVAACANTANKPAPAAPPAPAAARDDSLYRALGAQAGIEKVVDAALVEIHNDPHIDLFFANTDMPDLRRLLVEQFCAATGGPCEYTGRSMEEAHGGLNLTDEDFDRFVADLVRAFDKAAVPKDLQQQLLALFGPMRPQIVGQ